ncbi:TauD/TfdA family dioxygenase [Verticiella sediminum]|uniref:TauD/TfdA family dioxygenase n=1 Tax=Verticiella sediminum TaxID=1247510 RepID=A0A556A9A0_9BURK|nr:TauD/TfdA family dioxygenase [Verticiella sediminum]TSH89450.1 TauD/TfdA family dioxygenase [Verticiella sediminum]
MHETPLSPVMGIAIDGFDVRAMTPVVLEHVKARLADHGVVCFRGQTLSHPELVAFSARLGPFQHHVLTQWTLPEHPEIYVHSNIVENGRPLGNPREGFGWHTDLTYFERPTAYTVLYGVQVPREGGNTDFASLYAAYDALPQAQRERLQGCSVLRDYRKLYARRSNVEPLTEAQLARTPPTRHPLVRTHPVNGRKGLYLGGNDVVTVLDADGTDIGREIHDELLAFSIGETFRYSHQWRAGDLLVWDNRGLLHTATEYDREHERRLIYRTLIEGEVPR